jgi:hypothetical protein
VGGGGPSTVPEIESEISEEFYMGLVDVDYRQVSVEQDEDEDEHATCCSESSCFLCDIVIEYNTLHTRFPAPRLSHQ